LPEYEIVSSKSNDFSAQNLRPLNDPAPNEAMDIHNESENASEDNVEECFLNAYTHAFSSPALPFWVNAVAGDL